LENRKLLVISKSIINIFWVLQILFVLFLVVYTLLLVFHVDFINTDILRGFKIHFKSIDFIQPLMHDGQAYKMKLTNGEGRLHAASLNQNFIYFRILAAFIDSVMYLLIFYFLRKILKNLTSDNFFIPENGRLIKNIGYSIIALAIVPEVIHYFTDKMISRSISIENVVIKSEFHFDYQTILLGIIVFVISIVFLRGVEIKEEQDLTI